MMIEALSLSGEGERGDDGRADLSLGDEQGEIERVGEDVVVNEVGEEGDQVEEWVCRPQWSCQVT